MERFSWFGKATRLVVTEDGVGRFVDTQRTIFSLVDGRHTHIVALTESNEVMSALDAMFASLPPELAQEAVAAIRRGAYATNIQNITYVR
jgi:hypothetical protein